MPLRCCRRQNVSKQSAEEKRESHPAAPNSRRLLAFGVTANSLWSRSKNHFALPHHFLQNRHQVSTQLSLGPSESSASFLSSASQPEMQRRVGSDEVPQHANLTMSTRGTQDYAKTKQCRRRTCRLKATKMRHKGSLSLTGHQSAL